MEKSTIRAYYGTGAGKSSAALGYAVRGASEGRLVYIVQFMKAEMNYDYLKKLEPEIKVFRFERTKDSFEDLPADKRDEEIQNMKNGLNFARKVISTGEADLQILDEVLGLIDENIISDAELAGVLSPPVLTTDIILTGTHITPAIENKADFVYSITEEKGDH